MLSAVRVVIVWLSGMVSVIIFKLLLLRGSRPQVLVYFPWDLNPGVAGVDISAQRLQRLALQGVGQARDPGLSPTSTRRTYH